MSVFAWGRRSSLSLHHYPTSDPLQGVCIVYEASIHLRLAELLRPRRCFRKVERDHVAAATGAKGQVVIIGLIISGLVFVALLCLLVNVGLCLGGVRREGGRWWCSSSLLGGSLALLSTFLIAIETCRLVSLARSGGLAL